MTTPADRAEEARLEAIDHAIAAGALPAKLRPRWVEEGWNPVQVEVDLSGAPICVASYPAFESEVRRLFPDAHGAELTLVEETDRPFRFKVSGGYRGVSAAEEAKDSALAETRLRTSVRATMYVNELVRQFLTAELEGFKGIAHAGETPDDRKDAHLVVEAIQRAVRELGAANVLLSTRDAPVLSVTADSTPDQPPPGGQPIPVPGSKLPGRPS